MPAKAPVRLPKTASGAPAAMPSATVSRPRPSSGRWRMRKNYQAFQAAIMADYDAQSAVERELVLRLASLLWRLRRATTIETGLFEMQADQLHEFRQVRQIHPESRKIVYAMFAGADPADANPDRASDGITPGTNTVPRSEPEPVEPASPAAQIICSEDRPATTPVAIAAATGPTTLVL